MISSVKEIKVSSIWWEEVGGVDRTPIHQEILEECILVEMASMNGWVACNPRVSYDHLASELEEVEIQMSKRGYMVQVMIARDWEEKYIPFVKAVKSNGVVRRVPKNS